MKTKKTLWILGLAVVGLGTTAAVLLACDMASVSGRVTSSFSGEPLNTAWEAYVDLWDENWYCQQDQLSEADAADGKYRYSGVCPGNYTVSAWAYGYQSESASISVSSGASATHDFALDPVAANIAADVTGLDDACGSFTGGYRQVKVAIRYQEYCHYPQRLVVWAYSALTGPVIIYDNGTSYMDFYYLADPDVTDNPAYDGYDTTYRLSFGWDTRSLPNTSFTLKAYLRTGDPHGDGTDIDPDPNVEQWVHEAGTPPDRTADGTAGGTTVTTQVKNIVITDYRAANSPLPGYPQDAFLYDPDGTAAQANPTFSVTIDNWRNTDMEICVWMAATAWGDTRPVVDWDPYVDLAVTATGTYTLTWDGSNPGIWAAGGAEWGTWSFDIDAYEGDMLLGYTDWFFAKTHDGHSTGYDIYDVLVSSNHSVWWHCDETATPPGYQFRCNYVLNGHTGVPPSQVDLIAVRGLEKQGSVSTPSAPTALGVLHAPTDFYPAAATFTEEDTCGTWRTVFTGQTASGSTLRRDGTNPRILATNQSVTGATAELNICNEHAGPQIPKDSKVNPGTFVLVNNDDDDGANGADNTNDVVDGATDRLDMAKMTLQAGPTDANAARGLVAMLTVSAGNAATVRVFNENGASVDLPETIALSRFSNGAIDYYVEGRAAGTCTFSLRVTRGETSVCSPDAAKVTVKDYHVPFNAWGAWPGGHTDTTINPTETIKSTDLGLDGDVLWTVDHGGTVATIVSHTPEDGQKWNEIVVRYDAQSGSNTNTRAVTVKAYDTGANTRIAAVRRTVFRPIMQPVNTTEDLHEMNYLSYPEYLGATTRRKAGLAIPGQGGATQYGGKMETICVVSPTGIDWAARGVEFSFTGPPGSGLVKAPGKWHCLMTREMRNGTTLQRANEDVCSVGAKIDWTVDGDTSPDDVWYPRSGEGVGDFLSSDHFFRIDYPGHPATDKQICFRGDFRDSIEWYSATTAEFERCSDYALWFYELTAAYPNMAPVAPNNLGSGINAGKLANKRPVANAGPDQVVNSGALVTLSGKTTDADGNESTTREADNNPLLDSDWKWTRTAGPDVQLSFGGVGREVTFTAPQVTVPTVLTFNLVVDDGLDTGMVEKLKPGNAKSFPDTIDITVNPADP